MCRHVMLSVQSAICCAAIWQSCDNLCLCWHVSINGSLWYKSVTTSDSLFWYLTNLRQLLWYMCPICDSWNDLLSVQSMTACVALWSICDNFWPIYDSLCCCLTNPRHLVWYYVTKSDRFVTAIGVLPSTQSRCYTNIKQLELLSDFMKPCFVIWPTLACFLSGVLFCNLVLD